MKICSLCLALFWLTRIPTLGNAPKYMSILRQATYNIESGQYDDAAQAVSEILARDKNDPMALKVLGVIYLHTSQLDNAEAQFKAVLKSNPNDWQMHYALAIIYTVRGRTSIANQHIAAAATSPAASAELSALKAYYSFLSTESLTPDINESCSLPLALQISAMSAIRAGNQDKAAKLLLSLIQNFTPHSFEEPHGPLATFSKSHPIALPKAKLTWWKLGQPVTTPSVSGTVNLHADVNNIPGVTYVSFYVDDSFLGVTNCSPFEIRWNTEHYTNGLHQVRIEAKNQSGELITNKTLWVRIVNSGSSTSLNNSDIDNKIWNFIRINASPKLAHYELAKLYIQNNNPSKAIEHLEYTIAYQPDYPDAIELLNTLRGSQHQYSEANRGPSSSKRIALTFDDGPNERTAETLRMLAKLEIPATFFVVGFRAECQPDLLKAIHAAGHQIENHTYTHPNLTTLEQKQIELELAKTKAIIRSITGHDSLYFRPPGGNSNQTVKNAATSLGLSAVFWNISARHQEGTDWRELAEHVVQNATPGSIVLMHNGEPVTTAALPLIVQRLREQGYEFVTISELLGKPPTQLKDSPTTNSPVPDGEWSNAE